MKQTAHAVHERVTDPRHLDRLIGAPRRFERKRLCTIAAALACATSLLLPATAEPASRFSAELEVGPIWQSRNDVQIPNDDSGTRFSLVDVAGHGPWLAARLNLTWDINERHGLRVLLAPLSYTETGSLEGPVDFVEQTFQPGQSTEATYRFDSYRLTYRYRLSRFNRWSWWVGGTAKIRDAEIELRQGGFSARDSDVGFVPLVYLAANWRPSERWRVLVDLDALAGGPGRAIDLGLKVGVDVSDRWTLAVGYRTIEGGADTDDIYNFAWFHTAVVSGIYRF